MHPLHCHLNIVNYSRTQLIEKSLFAVRLCNIESDMLIKEPQMLQLHIDIYMYSYVHIISVNNCSRELSEVI